MTLKGLWRILRLPLFITAVADVLAGYMLGLMPHWREFDLSTALLLAGTATGLYLFGMVENDLIDVRRDRWLKIPRPLVTGEIGVPAAVILLVLTAALAGYCAVSLKGAALVCAIGAFGAINLYNLGAKHGPSYVAMIVMGLCRVLSFMMGVMIAGARPHGLNTGLGLLLPDGPLWARQAVALFCITAVVTGYSIMARRKNDASTRPWQFVLVGDGGRRVSDGGPLHDAADARLSCRRWRGRWPCCCWRPCGRAGCGRRPGPSVSPPSTPGSSSGRCTG